MTSTYSTGQNIHCGMGPGDYTKVVQSVAAFVHGDVETDLTECRFCGQDTDDPSFEFFHRPVSKFEVNQHKRELARIEKRQAWLAKQEAHRDAMARRQRQLDADARREVASVALRAVHEASVKGGK